MTRNRKRRWLVWCLVTFIAVGVLIAPLPVRDSDLEFATEYSARCLQNEDSVFLDWQYIPFYDAKSIREGKPQWHFANETELNIPFMAELSFSAMTIDESVEIDADWYKENVLVEIALTSLLDPNEDEALRFNVYHGLMAAQGYRVSVYRCILGVFVGYKCEWVS